MNRILNYYNSNYKDFIANTLYVDASELYPIFLKYLPEGSVILDVGCGSGRDSKYFLEKGYQVVAMDGSVELCRFASEYIGQTVHCTTFDEMDFENEFNGVWACASLLHIPYTNLIRIFKKISGSLKDGGYFYTSFKYGNYQGERNGRYFTDLDEERLYSIVESVPKLKVLEISVTEDIRGNKKGKKWLNVIMKKCVNNVR